MKYKIGDIISVTITSIVPYGVFVKADFDYTGGYRNDCRLLYSNDGLIFVTYDHYKIPHHNNVPRDFYAVIMLYIY